MHVITENNASLSNQGRAESGRVGMMAKDESKIPGWAVGASGYIF